MTDTRPSRLGALDNVRREAQVETADDRRKHNALADEATEGMSIPELFKETADLIKRGEV